ncbi:hypothetical protein JZO77_03545 [Enterococcus hulanensis]|uniref:hypothetical protein n=1 Tax=Enterococcus hulanensis TaxID=2559929 RepID=UPI001A8CD67E|nr:hypothetical protein [Enterococcus hulanensis]MBO0455813.1 hypothetical protein [Enterococcus hulanensis]
MSKDEALIKGTIDTILKYTYPNDYKDYLSYFIRIRPKELKSKHAHYIRKERMIEIFNLSRESRFLLITCIHEISHHVEYELTGDSGHDKSFYEIMQELYLTAVGLKLLNLTDIADQFDTANGRNMIKYFGEPIDWEVPIIPDMEKRMLIVKDGRLFKDRLRSREFYWFTVSQTWQKEFPTQQAAEQELAELLPFSKKDNFLIRPILSPTFLSYYYIGIENGYEYRYGLSELGYLWEGYGVNRMWVKKVDAQSYYEELRKLTPFAGIEYKKVTPKETKPPRKRKKKAQSKQAYKIDYYV